MKNILFLNKIFFQNKIFFLNKFGKNLSIICSSGISFWTARPEENISQIFPEKSAAHKLENRENKFADQVSETPGTPVPRLCSETVLKYFKRKNHFKVNVRLRHSNWHIKKNLQKIKSILYQDSC